MRDTVASTMTLKELPFDIYVHILKQLPADSAHPNDGPRTLAACLQSNSILRSAASVSTLWEPHYHVRYRICLPANELARRKALGDDWKSLYMERVRLDRQAIAILDYIVMERDGRLERARDVTSKLSYDVWNVLEVEAQYCRILDPFRGIHGNDQSKVAHHAIPRRFWARSLLGAIARNHAVHTWRGIKDDGDRDADTLEIAIACLSSYFTHPPMEISSLLDILSNFCRSYLAVRDIPAIPSEFNHSEGSLCRLSLSICEFLWDYGFRPAEYSRFNAFNTRFPHWFLTTHKDTIPISLVYIFVCLARRLGMKASPIDFPGRVLAIVSSPEPTVPDIIVDVFGFRTKAILSLQEDIPHLLVDAGTPPLPITSYIRPASTASMIVRASRNILASFSFLPMESISEGDLQTAFYVGFTVNLIFLNDRRYLLNIMKHISRFPLDILSVLTDALAPGLSPPIQELLLASCKAAHEDEDEAAASVTLRSKQSTLVQHFVGMIFKHAKYEYVGYIYGWEPSCMASEGWTTSMNVDSLPRGRHQPFYHVFTQNGSVRYVAEENIKPTTLKPYAYQQLFENAPEAGRYFEGFVQENERARLLLSPELLSAYPEDNAAGERWIKEGKTGWQ